MVERLASFFIQGLLYGIGAIGLGFSFRYLRFPDFTVLGSLMLGGVTCIAATNWGNPLVGILVGCLAGGCLGWLTATLHLKLRIPPVLAGIVTFVAAYSPGYFFSTGGRVAVDLSKYSIAEPVVLHSRFNILDVLFLVVVGFAILGALGVFMKTKVGSLLKAMGADGEFLRIRHHKRGRVFAIATVIANVIVACAGALYAFKSRSANVQAHFDFLPFALGGVFAGNAVLGWLTRRVEAGGARDASVWGEVNGTESDSSGVGARRLIHSPPVVLLSYACGALFLTLISGAVHANVLQEVNPVLVIPAHHQDHLAWAITAMLIVAFLAWARPLEGEF